MALTQCFGFNVVSNTSHSHIHPLSISLLATCNRVLLMSQTDTFVGLFRNASELR